MLITSLKNVEKLLLSFDVLNLVGTMTETLFTAMQMVFDFANDYPMNCWFICCI